MSSNQKNNRKKYSGIYPWMEYIIYMDEYELNFPESGDAEIETLKHPLDANVNWKDKRSDELDFRMSAKPEVKGQKVETKKRMLSKAKGLESNPAVNKERDKNKAKSPPKRTGHCDNESSLEGSRRGDEISNITKLKSDITGHLNELQKAATCNQDPVAKVNKSQLNTKNGSKSTSCEEREGPKSNEVEQAGSVTLKHMSHDEDTQSNHFYDLYEGLGAEEEKVDTNKSASIQKGAGSEIILHLLRRSASGLSVIRNVNRRFLSWRASAFPKTQRNKGAEGQNGKNNKRRHKNACPPGVCHEAPQHRVDENQVSAHNKMGRESEWSTDAEYAYDEMTEFEQQPSKEYLNGINSNADADLYDDLDAEENSHAMESVVHKPIPKICDSKYKNIGNKLPNSVDKLKDRKSSKSPSAKTNCRESSHEALHDGIPDRGGGDGEIYMNEEIFKNLADPGRNDSPPPIPPKMCQITQPHNNGEKNSKKTHATAIPNELSGGIFTSLTRQFSHTRTALPTKKQNTRGKQVTRVLGLCAMKPGRGKKPARLKEAKTPQMNAETHAAEMFNGKIGTDVLNGGEDEYEEYCYASELVDQPELDQQVHLDKLLCNKGGLSMNESMKVEKSSDMPPAVESYLNEDLYEDPETSPARVSMYCEEKLMDRHKNGPELQRNSEKMLQAPRVKQNDDVQKLSDRRLPAPPIPLSESTTHIKPNVPMQTNSSVLKPCQSFPQIKQQRKEQIPKKPPKHNPPVSSTTCPNNQLPKSGTTHPHHGTKEDLVTMPSKAKANTDNSHDDLKSASQPKTAPRIPPRPQYIPQSLLLKLANSTEISGAQKRPPTPEVTEQRTNQRGEQTNSGLVETEKPGENQLTTMKNQDATCSNETASALECENDLYMQLEDCYG